MSLACSSFSDGQQYARDCAPIACRLSRNLCFFVGQSACFFFRLSFACYPNAVCWREQRPADGDRSRVFPIAIPSWVCAQRLSPYALFIFNHLGLQRRIGLGIAVVALLKLLLCIEKVVHCDGSCLIEIAVEAQVFFALVDAFLGQEQLFVGIVEVIPILLYANFQQLCIVGQLLLRAFFGQPFALNGVRSAFIASVEVLKSMPTALTCGKKFVSASCFCWRACCTALSAVFMRMLCCSASVFTCCRVSICCACATHAASSMAVRVIFLFIVDFFLWCMFFCIVGFCYCASNSKLACRFRVEPLIVSQ